MKRIAIIFTICFVSFYSLSVLAIQFSASLGSGGSANVPSFNNGRRAIHSQSDVNYGRKNSRSTVRKTVLRFKPEQTELDETQKQKIMPIIKRIQEGKTTDLEVVGISRSDNKIYHRQMGLDQFFRGYVTNVRPFYRYVSGNAVMNSNDNTMEIFER